MVGRTGSIDAVFDMVSEDVGLLTFLDDIAKQRLDPRAYMPDTPHHKKEGVMHLLVESKKLPAEIYNPEY